MLFKKSLALIVLMLPLSACDDPAGGDEYQLVPGYTTIADFVTDPAFAAFMTQDGTGFDYCTGTAGDFGLTGVYEPHLQVVSCADCDTVGLPTDETERVSLCFGEGNLFDTGIGTVDGYFIRTRTLAGQCSADPTRFTFYTAFIQRASECEMTWITIETHRFWPGYASFTDGDRVDLVVHVAGRCAPGTPKAGDWFRLGPQEDYWAPLTLVRRDNCPGDDTFYPSMCAFVQPCVFGDECGTGTFCNFGAEFVPTCVPDACQACFDAEEICSWYHDCSFDACVPIEAR